MSGSLNPGKPTWGENKETTRKKRNHMLHPLVHKPPTVGIFATIDPRTYPVAGIPEGCVKRQQLPVVLNRLGKTAEIARQLTLYDGGKLKVVVASIPVGGPREAAIVQQEFEEAGVDFIVNSMVTWSMGWETDLFGHPEWLEAHEAMNGTAWPGAVLLNSKRASATALGRQVYSIYPPDVEEMSPEAALHPESVRKLTQFLRCAASVTQLRGSNYASMGHVSMGIAGSEPISDVLLRWFGMKLVHIDQTEILARVQKNLYARSEVDRACQWFFKNFSPRIDPVNRRDRKQIEALVRQWLVPMTLAIRGIMRGEQEVQDEERGQGVNALFGGTAGQRYWTDHYPNFDFPEAVLTSSFDWNGLRTPIILATENDWLNGMGMQWALMLTGFTSLFADLRTYWSVKRIRQATRVDLSGIAPTGFVHLINSGPAALDWATNPGNPDHEERRQKAIEGTEWHPAELGYFPNDGLSTHFCTHGGLPITMLRLNRIGLDLTLSVVQGRTLGLPDNVYRYVRDCTNPTWPDTFVVPDHLDAFDFMNRGNDPNHVATGIGHFGAEARLLASMLRIPVDYTNITEEQTLLPTSWRRLGGDRRACDFFGPRYA